KKIRRPTRRPERRRNAQRPAGVERAPHPAAQRPKSSALRAGNSPFDFASRAARGHYAQGVLFTASSDQGIRETASIPNATRAFHGGGGRPLSSRMRSRRSMVSGRSLPN